jgi:ferredoxin
VIWLKKKWQRKILTLLWPFRFIGARLTKFPPVGRLVKHFFFDGDFAVYLPHKKAQKGQVKVVLPDAVVNYFIEQASFRFQMNGCVCRETNRCQNYPSDLGCLFLGEAARGINPALGREVSVAEAKAIQKRVDELGLINMVGKLRLDRVLLAVSSGERLLTICHCCECCCLFNLLPYLATPIGRSIQKLDGVEVSVDGPCRGCGRCVETCFARAISIEEGKAVIGEQCRGCGRCVTSCPAEAITLTIEKDDFIEESILRIRSYVQVD